MIQTAPIFHFSPEGLLCCRTPEFLNNQELLGLAQLQSWLAGHECVAVYQSHVRLEILRRGLIAELHAMLRMETQVPNH